MQPPLSALTTTLQTTGLSRLLESFAKAYPDEHLKDQTIEAVGCGREIVIAGRRLVNFGSDSFLGLDRDARLHEALRRGIERWGTHSGASRAFASVAANVEAEKRIAAWLGSEAALIYPSVTLANLGAIPALVAKQDVAVIDEFGHNSMQDALRLAKGAGVRTATFAHNGAEDLRRVLQSLRPYRHALVCVDGVYSMSGTLPPFAALADVCRSNDAVLYVDDAHGTGVVGPSGTGAVRAGGLIDNNVIIAGSLSKAFSCLGAYVACSRAMQRQLKIRSNTFIFGGPVPPCYLEAVMAVIDILESAEYDGLLERLQSNVNRFTVGAKRLGFEIFGGVAPIIALAVGDEGDTLRAGRALFDRGYYVQSVTFPAVPYHAGVLRVQLNAIHTAAQVDGLLEALRQLSVPARQAA